MYTGIFAKKKRKVRVQRLEFTFNMATCELKGELKYRDGLTNQFVVKVDDNLKSMITGIKKINADISEVLTALVEQEKGSTGNCKGDVDDDEEEDCEEEDSTKETAAKSNTEPPKKRIKTLRT
ncbi:uncharacterized protein si:dkeyp-55f12.3 [Xyrauchen texanus]|uniref:uncharacterized protein si:dkeyp-55f12.3 n=1 Tax=Xyrauchen texanus TaxID=154827 RepID=UPI0022423997|nr:uncharacterized protein si:dkeyp-55f12.3 [Xyrauchen texanus]